MDLIIGSTDTVKFSVPNGVSTATFTITKNGTTSTNANAVVSNGVASCKIPYMHLTSAGQIRVDLKFNYESTNHTKTEFVDIIKPYIELFALRGMYPGKTDEQLVELETVARQRIEAYCGQDFNYYPNVTYNAIGRGERALEMPKRLANLIDIEVDGEPLPPGYEVSDYYIRYTDIWLGIKDAPPDWVHGEVIDFPYLETNYKFARNRVYAITGDWGYESVPGPVISAMKTLIKHYSSRVSEMQESGIKSAKAADWTLQFGDSASGNAESTGNSHADSLLSDYVVNHWVVV